MSEIVASTQVKLIRTDGSWENFDRAQDTGSCWAQSTDLTLGSTTKQTFLDKVFIELDLEPNAEEEDLNNQLFLEIGYRQNLAEILQYAAPIHINAGVKYYNIKTPEGKPLPGAIWYVFTLKDTAISLRWKLTAFELWGDIGGEQF